MVKKRTEGQRIQGFVGKGRLLNFYTKVGEFLVHQAIAHFTERVIVILTYLRLPIKEVEFLQFPVYF